MKSLSFDPMPISTFIHPHIAGSQSKHRAMFEFIWISSSHFLGKVSPIVTVACSTPCAGGRGPSSPSVRLTASDWPTFLYSQTPVDTCWIMFWFCFDSVLCLGDICKLELQKWTRLRFFANRHKQNEYKQNSKMFDAAAFPFKKTFPRSITWFAELDLGSQSTLTLLKFFYPIPFPLAAFLLF